MYPITPITNTTQAIETLQHVVIWSERSTDDPQIAMLLRRCLIRLNGLQARQPPTPLN